MSSEIVVRGGFFLKILKFNEKIGSRDHIPSVSDLPPMSVHWKSVHERSGSKQKIIVKSFVKLT